MGCRSCRPQASDEIPPAGERAAGAQRLAESAAGRPACLTGGAVVTGHQARVDVGEWFLADVADDRVDLLDARRDVADVIDVEALDPGATRRQRPSGEERIHAVEVFGESPEVRIAPPQPREIAGDGRTRARASRGATEPTGGKQRDGMADTVAGAHLEQGLELPPVVLHEKGHDVDLAPTVRGCLAKRVDGAPGSHEGTVERALPVVTLCVRVVDRDADLDESGVEESARGRGVDVPAI